MRILRPLLLASSFLVVPLGTGHAQAPPPNASGQPATAPPAQVEPTAQPVAPGAPSAQPSWTPAEAPAPADASAATGSAPSGGRPPLQVEEAVAGGIGLAGIAVGLALVGAALSVQGSLRASVPRDLRGNPTCGSTSNTNVVPFSGDERCAELRAQAKLGTDLGNAGASLLIGGGLLVGAAAAYWLLSGPPPARSARSTGPQLLRVLPAVSPTGGGLVVVGSF